MSDSLTPPDQAGLLSRLEVEVEADVLIDKCVDVGNGLRFLLSIAFDGDGPRWLGNGTGRPRGVENLTRTLTLEDRVLYLTG